MTAAEWGVLLLCCALPGEEKPLSLPQFQELGRRVRALGCRGDDPLRELTARDLARLGYDAAQSARITRLLARQAQLEQYLTEQLGRETEISHYGSGEALLADWRPGAFELVVLDIYMGGATGMEVARRLRADDGQVRLAFATSSNDFASESYEVGACYYLRKPFRPEGVRAMLERLDLEALERSRRLRLPDGSQVVLRSIRYAASDGHRVTLHCKDGDRTLRTSFAAVEPLLCAYPCFCGICRGVVVNFHEVAGRQEDVFLLKDGTRLPISRRRLREVQEAYSAFRFDRLRKDGVD